MDKKSYIEIQKTKREILNELRGLQQEQDSLLDEYSKRLDDWRISETQKKLFKILKS